MSIKDCLEKIKFSLANFRTTFKLEKFERYYTAAIVILVGLSSFGLGRLSVLDESRQPVTIEQDGATTTDVTSQTSTTVNQTQTASVATSMGRGEAPPAAAAGGGGGKIVASRNGTKYYYPWCASNIAEKNKIWFASETEARGKGYRPAANCKGLK